MSEPTSTDDLRGRLTEAFSHGPLRVLPDRQIEHLADLAIAAFRDHVESDATVERVARAMIANRFSVDEPELEADATSTKVGSVYLMHARVGLAALAAALAPETEET